MQTEPKLNSVYSSNILPKIENEAYSINLEEYNSVETHWITLYANANNLVEHITKEIYKNIRHKNLMINIYRTQVYD